MAYSESATIVSAVAGSTFSAADVYKAVVVNSSGKVVVPDTTGNVMPYGSLYARTATTGGGEAVPVAIGGNVKVRLSASTLSAGDYISASTNGFWGALTTDGYVAGQIVSGSSGNIRVVTANLLKTGLLLSTAATGI